MGIDCEISIYESMESLQRFKIKVAKIRLTRRRDIWDTLIGHELMKPIKELNWNYQNDVDAYGTPLQYMTAGEFVKYLEGVHEIFYHSEWDAVFLYMRTIPKTYIVVFYWT